MSDKKNNKFKSGALKGSFDAAAAPGYETIEILWDTGNPKADPYAGVYQKDQERFVVSLPAPTGKDDPRDKEEITFLAFKNGVGRDMSQQEARTAIQKIRKGVAPEDRPAMERLLAEAEKNIPKLASTPSDYAFEPVRGRDPRIDYSKNEKAEILPNYGKTVRAADGAVDFPPGGVAYQKDHKRYLVNLPGWGPHEHGSFKVLSDNGDLARDATPQEAREMLDTVKRDLPPAELAKVRDALDGMESRIPGAPKAVSRFSAAPDRRLEEMMFPLGAEPAAAQPGGKASYAEHGKTEIMRDARGQGLLGVRYEEGHKAYVIDFSAAGKNGHPFSVVSEDGTARDATPKEAREMVRFAKDSLVIGGSPREREELRQVNTLLDDAGRKIAPEKKPQQPRPALR